MLEVIYVVIGLGLGLCASLLGLGLMLAKS